MNKNGSSRPILCIIFGPIGDTLITLALFDDILSLAPDSKITLATSSNVKMISALASAYPEVTVKEIPSKPLGLVAFLFSVLTRRWTVIIPGTAKYYSLHLKLFFMLLSAIPGNRTIGFGDIRKKGGWLPFQVGLFVDIHISVLNNYRKMLRYFLPDSAALRAIDARETHVRLSTKRPASFPYKKGEYIVMHMFGTRARLSFMPKRWTALIEEFRKRYPALSIVLTGGKKDEVLIREISKGMTGGAPGSEGSGTPGVLVSINMPILEVAGVIEDSALYLGVDTGVTHLASVMHKPAIVIGNNSNPLWWPNYNPNVRILVNNERCTCTGDKNDDCRVRGEDGEMYYRCTYDIRDEQIWKAVGEFI